MRREIFIESEGLKIHGMFFSPESGSSRVVVFCHGIPLSRPEPNDPGYEGLAASVCDSGYSALFFNMRGTGLSQGNFDPLGWYVDLIEVMRVLGDYEKRYLVGFSFGAMLSIRYAALHRDVSGVASFASPFTLREIFPPGQISRFIDSAREIGIIRDSNFPPSIDWFLERFESMDLEKYLPLVKIPLLVVHGEEDELVPIEHAKRIFDLAGGPKAIEILPGGTHRLRRDKRVTGILLSWLHSLE